MVILVWFGVHDDSAGEVGFLRELVVALQRRWGGLVGRQGMEGKAIGIGSEQMDVRVDQWCRGLSGESEWQWQKVAALHVLMICPIG